MFRFDSSGTPRLSSGDQISTINVWASLSPNLPAAMANMDDLSDFKVVLNNFLLPSVEGLDINDSHFVICSSNDVHIWRDWASSHPAVTLIFLPPRSPDLNPFDVLWADILQAIRHVSFYSKEQLWQEIADYFDRLTSTKNYWSSSASSMAQRLDRIERVGGCLVY
jgi:hypothetical protein